VVREPIENEIRIQRSTLADCEVERPMVDIGLNVVDQRPITDQVGWWRAADAAGVTSIAIPDSPALLNELYVAATACAIETSSARVMTSVTNPVTRDPSVTAAALASLHELAPGRIVFGIGTGDSALWGVGLRPATIARLRDYIGAVRSLLRGEDATYDGRTFRSRWSWRQNPIEIPVHVPVAGPKITHMAAQVADGLLLSMGCGPENVSYVTSLVNQACDEVGRDPSELEMWWNSEVVFGDDADDAKARALGVSTSWLTMGGMEGKQIPDELQPAVQRFNADIHDLSNSYQDGDRQARLIARARELGIYDWLLSRAPGLWGRPDEIAARLHELHDHGMEKWMLYVGRRPDAVEIELSRLCADLLPRLGRPAGEPVGAPA
jgi:5,10-methylenetetrahydromethanopterin reductase